jgi:hypothetical protein
LVGAIAFIVVPARGGRVLRRRTSCGPAPAPDECLATNAVARHRPARTSATATKRSPGLGRIFAGAHDWIRLGHAWRARRRLPVGGDTGTLASHATSPAFVSATASPADSGALLPMSARGSAPATDQAAHQSLMQQSANLAGELSRLVRGVVRVSQNRASTRSSFRGKAGLLGRALTPMGAARGAGCAGGESQDWDPSESSSCFVERAGGGLANSSLGCTRLPSRSA